VTGPGLQSLHGLPKLERIVLDGSANTDDG
jgi:hypothetical protein